MDGHVDPFEENVMRTLIALALALAMSTSAIGQQSSPSTGKVKPLSTVPRNSVAATKYYEEYYKQDVYDKSRQKIGEIVDVLVSQDGKTTGLVIDAGGVLGIGTHNVVVPMSAVQVTKTGDKTYLVIDTTKDALKSAPGFRYEPAARTWVRETVPYGGPIIGAAPPAAGRPTTGAAPTTSAPPGGPPQQGSRETPSVGAPTPGASPGLLFSLQGPTLRPGAVPRPARLLRFQRTALRPAVVHRLSPREYVRCAR
jgi:hypothetical protein